jgi:hypothetical protein
MFILLIDEEVRNKKFIPGIGKYTEVEKGYKILSRPVTSLRRRR